jgi:hypothetical protein
MKTFKFELTFTDEQLEGDEFWEEALNQDGIGIAALIESVESMVKGSNLIDNRLPIGNIVKLSSYTDSET